MSASAPGEVTVQLLYFEGCPNHEALLEHVRRLLRDGSIAAKLELMEVPDEIAAERERFLGSPSVRVAGRDIEPGAAERSDFGLKCRLYRSASGLRGTPPDEWLLAALREAAA